MAGDLILTFDIGSSSCKAALFSATGECVAVAKHDIAPTATESGFGAREYDSSEWISGAIKSARKLGDAIGDLHGKVAAIGLSGQIGTHIVALPDGSSRYPAVSWQDQRAKREAQELAARFPGFALDTALGMHLPPGTAWPIPRLLWIKRNAPEMLEKGALWIQPKEYLCHFLTGRMVTDYLSLRGLMHPERHSIDPLIKNEILGIPDLEDHLPEAAAPSDRAGGLNAHAARLLRLDQGIPVVLGAGDFHCAALGSGVTDASSGFNITGTSDHIGMLVEAGDLGARSEALGRYPSLIPGKDILYGATSSSGGMLDWIVTTLGGKRRGESFGNYLERELKGAKPQSGIVCLPYLNGERAPIWDAEARVVFAGIGKGHRRADLIFSVLEGVAFSLRHNKQILDEIASVGDCVRVCGASSANMLWNRIKANVLKTKIEVPQNSEVSNLGAAMLAAVSVGIHPDIRSSVRSMSKVVSVIEPEPSTYPYYDKMYECYVREYAANREIFPQLSKVREMRAVENR